MRKICVATGSRAEYGHMRWLVRDIAEDPALTLQLLVTGMHLESRFGLTYREIETDGLVIDEKVAMPQESDTPAGIARSIGNGVIGIAEALNRLDPDVLVILGDRFEMLAAAQAALVLRIPIAHLHGGESTEGAFDEAIRHSITKMAHLHFVAAEAYARRVVQLGEHPDRVFCVGTPGLDTLTRQPLMARDDLQRSLGFDLGDSFFLVTYHPETLSEADPVEAVGALTGALDDFPETRVVITGVNADPANRRISAALEAYAESRPDRVLAVTSLGQHRYLSALKLAGVVIGNSSSGLIEAPAVGTPTVNVSNRQKGRLRAASVINCQATRANISAAIMRAMTPELQSLATEQDPPYGRGGASRAIKETLAATPLEGLVQKSFYDLEPARP